VTCKYQSSPCHKIPLPPSEPIAPRKPEQTPHSAAQGPRFPLTPKIQPIAGPVFRRRFPVKPNTKKLLLSCSLSPQQNPRLSTHRTRPLRPQAHFARCLHTLQAQTHAMADKEYTYSDVSEHNTKKDLFIVVHDKVYNASSFVDEHPYVVFLY